MGSGSDRKRVVKHDPRQLEAFDLNELKPKPRQASLELRLGEIALLSPAAVPTSAKSRLIAEYVRLFQKVTRGGLYIDGFAAPQSRRHEDAWTARRVLEIMPPRLRVLWLCDNDPDGLQQLRALKDRHAKRPGRVFVMSGDFNKTVHMILNGGRLTPRATVFALLDQRNTECHWATVQAIARKGGRYKIELLYFLGVSWLHRSLSQARTAERISDITRWWGGPGWQQLVNLSQAEIVRCVADRFAAELGYKFVKPYPLYRTENGTMRAFYLMHASDHPEAPTLMDRAYRKILGDVAGSPVDSQRDLFQAGTGVPPPCAGAGPIETWNGKSS